MPNRLTPPHDHWSASAVRDWVAIDTDYRDKRHFLEVHIELLDVRTMDFLTRALNLYADELAMQDMLRAHLQIVRHALSLEGDPQTRACIACVNQYGPAALVFPDWLEVLERQLVELASSRAPHESAPERVRLLRPALARAEQEAASVPPVLASLRIALWDALGDDPAAQTPGSQEEGIALLRAALDAFPRDLYPLQRAGVLLSLASAFVERRGGTRVENVRESVSLYEEALACCPREHWSFQWAQIQLGLANAYFQQRDLTATPAASIERGIACCESALEVFTESQYPDQWGLCKNTLGNLYQERVIGGRAANHEEAINSYQAALGVFTIEAQPARFAMLQNNLGVALRNRVGGDPIANAEWAMKAHFEALRVYTKEAYPLDYAMTLCQMAAVSLARPAVSVSVNITSAIRGYQEALHIYTRDQYPEQYASTQHNLGIAYADRPGGRSEDIEHAIAAYREALRVYTKTAYPGDHARTLINLGNAYFKRPLGVRTENLQVALASYAEAEEIYTAEAFPHEYRACQLNRVLVEADRGRWEEVHVAYAGAAVVERRLLREAVGEDARAALLREGRDTALRDGYALARLGRAAEAAEAIERGRARGLAEWLALDDADPSTIADGDRRSRFEAARAALRLARAALYDQLRPVLDEQTFLHEWDAPADTTAERQAGAERIHAYRQAQARLEASIMEIQAAGDPQNFMGDTMDANNILHVAETLGPGHAMVYLVATPWGGIAVGAFAPNPLTGAASHFATLDLPDLGFEHVFELVQSRLSEETLHIIGGFGHAQRGSGYQAIMLPLWSGATFRERARSLYDACLAVGKPSTLSAAAQLTLRVPALAETVERPLAGLDPAGLSALQATMNHLFLKAELDRCLTKLSATAMRPLSAWLSRRRISGITLIPCGFLEAFPLAAAPLEGDARFAEVAPVSVAPSARALQPREAAAPSRDGILAIGDPRPTPQELPWAEAEALTLAKLARLRGLRGEAQVHGQATREWLVQALQQAHVVDASCHGAYHVLDFLRSVLLLAEGETISLADMLRGTVNVRGLRLCILSACQTAIPDLRRQSDEVRSLAGGMIQAGAQAVLAALWPVDDQATFILVLRFAQEWLPNVDHEPPAAALVRAQRWVRDLTYKQLLAWQTTAFVDLAESELGGTGASADWTAPWHQATEQRDEVRTPIPVRGGGSRYSVAGAQRQVRIAGRDALDDERPYAHPIYWAGFQIVGW